MDDAGRPEPPIEVGRESSPPTPRGTAASQPSWKDLQSEFLQYAAEHAELSAVWRWMYTEHTIATAVSIAVSQGPDVDPNDVLRRMYRHPDVSARPPAPKGQWTLEGGSPLSQDLFRVIAGRASSRLPNPSDAEPWRLWLDGLRAEGYAPELPARSKSGQILGRYPQGFEDRHIEHVFGTSADFCFVRSRAEAATPNPVASGTPEAGDPIRLAAVLSQESAEGATADFPRLPPDTSVGRPKLPAEALQNIIEAEKAATRELEKALGFHSPSNPNFVYHPVEINAGCWKVIEHLTTFAEAIFNAQAREYAKHYPALVSGGGLLTAEVGPEVVRRTKLNWTRWETAVDFELRARWTPGYYQAYLEESDHAGSEDQKLMAHFQRRLDQTVAERISFWRQQARAAGNESPPKSEDAARTMFGEPSRAASEPAVAYGGAAPSTDGPAAGTEEETQAPSLRRDKHDSSARDGAMTVQIEPTVASAEQEAADSSARAAAEQPATRFAEPPSVAARELENLTWKAKLDLKTANTDETELESATLPAEAALTMNGSDVPDQPDAAGQPEQNVESGPLVKDAHVDLLEAILKKGPTTLEKWAKGHKLGRTTVFDWKALRSAGKSLSGKVSTPKNAEIEQAIDEDAKALGLWTRTLDSD